MKKKLLCTLALGAVTFASSFSFASAHGVFIADRLDQKALVLGEGPYDNVYEPSNVTKVEGYDVHGVPTAVKIIPTEHNVLFDVPKNIGTTVTFFDYGYWTKDKDGVTHHQPINQVPNAVKSTHAIKWNTHLWNAEATPMRIANIPIQIVPDVNPLTLRKGDKYNIQVFKDGKPMANAPLINDVINDLTNESTTDENGRATIEVTANGLNVVGVEIAYPTAEKNVQNKYFSSLSFIIDPE